METFIKQYGSFSCPLPDKIPVREDQVMQLWDFGFRLGGTNRPPFMTYTLPKDWQRINVSDDTSHPSYLFIDQKHIVRVTAYGLWKPKKHRAEFILSIVTEPWIYPFNNDMKMYQKLLDDYTQALDLYQKNGEGHEDLIEKRDTFEKFLRNMDQTFMPRAHLDLLDIQFEK